MNLREYEILFDLPSGEYDRRAVGGIRTTTIRAGRSLEVMCCPITKVGEAAKRAAKERRTKPSMEELNRKNRMRRFMRLTEANFTERSFVFTGTYEYPTDDPGMVNREELLEYWEEHRLPESVDDCRRDVRNFLNRVKRRVLREGGDPKAVKWLYRVEEGKEQTMGLPPRYHFHMVIEAEGLTQDDLKALWPNGFARCDRLDLRHDGAARLARYLAKQKRGGRWWFHSRNLKNPPARVSDRRVSRRRAALIAEDVRRNGREILEKLYPGYRLMEEPEVRYSDYVAGAYIYARMRMRD